MQVSVVLPEHIELVWPNIEQYMSGAAQYTYNRFNTNDIKKDLINKPQQLWIAYDEEEVYGAVVTEIIVYPKMTTLMMHFTGGKKLPRWKQPMLKLLQRFAKDQGCNVIESYGRPGWEKVFKNDGYKEVFKFYELPVE
jgi:hypothetical protein